jgi:hypothetical protein
LFFTWILQSQTRPSFWKLHYWSAAVCSSQVLRWDCVVEKIGMLEMSWSFWKSIPLYIIVDSWLPRPPLFYMGATSSN